MKQKGGTRSSNIAPVRQILRRPTFASFLESDPLLTANTNEASSPYNNYYACGNSPPTPISGDASPSNNYTIMSPAAWSQASPFIKSPWQLIPRLSDNNNSSLIGTIVREEGHVYSLAASKDGLLYTGSDSKNIHVWKNLKEFTGFKSNSGLVKAIVAFGDRIFTGHQDGKIRVWRVSSRNPGVYRRIGSLPTLKEYIKMAMNTKNFVQIRRHHNSLRIKHFDAVSCLSLDSKEGLLYSGSWDKSLKVWRIQDYKCLESIEAHDDAINSVAVGFDGLVFTGSADGTVKAWRKEMKGRKQSKHVLAHTLLKQDKAVTAVVVLNGCNDSSVVYSGSSDGMVNFWEWEKDLSHGGVLLGHTMAVLCLASAGCLIFSGSADKTICVWRRDVGGIHTCLSVLTGHDAPIKCLAVEQDDNIREEEEELSVYGIPPHRNHLGNWVLYSGGLDKSVKVWSVSENKSPEEEYNINHCNY